MKLIYLPLEPYAERYTSLMSKKGGWAEDKFNQNKIPFIRIEGKPTSGKIKTGSVVDAYGRSFWAMEQTAQVLEMLKQGAIHDGDVIYTEDFWHPGIESLFYVRDITGIKFRVGCFMHAQSIDDSDFTYPMRYWIGDVERGFSNGYDHVFVTSPILKGIAENSGWNGDNIHLTGLPYNKRMLLKEYGHLLEQDKEPFVLFSSRFDSEKNPHFFLDLVEACPDIQFKLVKPREVLSNDSTATNRANEMSIRLGNFEIVDTSKKEKYYDLLGRAEVQFNCAIQDWVSWTLVEATTARCKPLYPKWKDFPHELKGFDECLYENKNLDSAIAKLRGLMANEKKDYIEIANKHDMSWNKKLSYMGFFK